MTKPWEAEVEITPQLAQSLVESQFPKLVVKSCGELGRGWDNTLFLVNDAWLFRFPHRGIAVDCLEVEARILPSIAPQLPLPVPVPVFLGAPCDQYTWPFLGYRMIPGRTACSAALDRRQRLETAATIARFLHLLHAIPAKSLATQKIPSDTWGRFDPNKRIP